MAAMTCFGPATAVAMEKPWNSWQTSIDGNHRHVGRIWSVDDNKFVSHEDLVRALSDADFRQLGETHDNPDHHRLQAWLIQEIVRGGKHPPLSWR